MALGFVISSMMENILHFYIGMGILMALGFAALPMSTQAIVISNWFIRRRGQGGSGLPFCYLVSNPDIAIWWQGNLEFIFLELFITSSVVETKGR